jgi:heme-degrading monooxygenase HmoA
MEIIMVHWLIRKDRTARFLRHWRKNMNVGKAKGFYREVLTKPVSKPDPKFNTFSITDENYVTYINIGFWESVEHFEAAIKKWFPRATQKRSRGKVKHSIELEDFEFKVRERVVLEHLDDRGANLPPATLPSKAPRRSRRR